MDSSHLRGPGSKVFWPADVTDGIPGRSLLRGSTGTTPQDFEDLSQTIEDLRQRMADNQSMLDQQSERLNRLRGRSDLLDSLTNPPLVLKDGPIFFPPLDAGPWEPETMRLTTTTEENIVPRSRCRRLAVVALVIMAIAALYISGAGMMGLGHHVGWWNAGQFNTLSMTASIACLAGGLPGTALLLALAYRCKPPAPPQSCIILPPDNARLVDDGHISDLEDYDDDTHSQNADAANGSGHFYLDYAQLPCSTIGQTLGDGVEMIRAADPEILIAVSQKIRNQYATHRFSEARWIIRPEEVGPSDASGAMTKDSLPISAIGTLAAVLAEKTPSIIDVLAYVMAYFTHHRKFPEPQGFLPDSLFKFWQCTEEVRIEEYHTAPIIIRYVGPKHLSLEVALWLSNKD